MRAAGFTKSAGSRRKVSPTSPSHGSSGKILIVFLLTYLSYNSYFLPNLQLLNLINDRHPPPSFTEVPSRSQMVLEETPREANRKMELDIINLIEECSRDMESGDVSFILWFTPCTVW